MQKKFKKMQKTQKPLNFSGKKIQKKNLDLKKCKNTEVWTALQHLSNICFSVNEDLKEKMAKNTKNPKKAKKEKRQKRKFQREKNLEKKCKKSQKM